MTSNPTTSGRQRGGFAIGLIVGLLVGLAIALGVALYITKAPNPFVNKVPPRPAAQDAAETERNRSWDPNAALAGKNPASAATAAVPTLPPTPPSIATVPPLMPAAVDPLGPSPGLGSRPPTAASSAAPAFAAASNPSPSTLRPPPVFPAGTGSDPFYYFVQAGAFERSEDAEQQRARLAMLGVESKLTEREQGGRTVYRVRVGPFDKKDDADAAKNKLVDSGVDSALVRVQK